MTCHEDDHQREPLYDPAADAHDDRKKLRAHRVGLQYCRATAIPGVAPVYAAANAALCGMARNIGCTMGVHFITGNAVAVTALEDGSYRTGGTAGAARVSSQGMSCAS